MSPLGLFGLRASDIGAKNDRETNRSHLGAKIVFFHGWNILRMKICGLYVPRTFSKEIK